MKTMGVAMQPDEPELVKRIRAGDVQALASFLERKRQPLTAWIDRQLGLALRRKVEPEDVFQEVSTDAVRTLGEMNLADRDPFAWLCQIAQRRIIDAHRYFFGAQKRNAAREAPLGSPSGDSRRPGLIDMLAASLTTPSQAFSRNAREARLLEALNLLTDEQRECLRLRYVEGLPSKQVAQRVGKSDAAVRVMLTRSLKRLQTILSEE